MKRMQYRLQTLLWTVLGVALGIAAFRLMPMLMLSCIFLTPFPALITFGWLCRNRPYSLTRRPRLLFTLASISIALFYVGMSGPLFAVFALPDQFPILNRGEHLKTLSNILYSPLSSFVSDLENTPIRAYHYWWLSLVMILVESPE